MLLKSRVEPAHNSAKASARLITVLTGSCQGGEAVGRRGATLDDNQEIPDDAWENPGVDTYRSARP